MVRLPQNQDAVYPYYDVRGERRSRERAGGGGGREVELPEKDWPILGGAIAAEATHLITGGIKHFGRDFGKRIHGILVLPRTEYIRGINRTF